MFRAALVLIALLAARGVAVAQTAYVPPADMQTLYIYFLKTGPNTTATPEERKALQAQHMAHLNGLGAKIAGPFVNGGEWRGLVLLEADSVAAARAKADADPAVQAGIFQVEAYTVTAPGNWFEIGPVPEPYTMRRFVFAFFDAAPQRPAVPETEMTRLMEGHLANLHRLAKAGRLLFGGPLAGGGTHRGIVVLATESLDEARQWMADDPMLKAGQMTLTPLVWFAADGIFKVR